MGYCAWNNMGHSCNLSGVRSNSRGVKARYYCNWHIMCLDNPKLASDFKAFQKWHLGFVAKLHEVKYPTIEKHQFDRDANVLWQKMTGMYGTRPARDPSEPNDDLAF